MRTFKLFLLISLASQMGLGQNDYRVIGASDHVKESVSTDFFIHSIEDQRAFQANLGIVNRGVMKDLKRPLIQESDFFGHILKRANSWLRPGDGPEPVVAKILELYLWENEWMNNEKGFVHLEIAFAGLSGQGETIISVELSGKEIMVSNGHAPRLETAFFRCLQEYNEGRKNAVKNNASAPPARPKAGKADILAAGNFLDLWKGSLSRVSGNLRSRGDLYRYQLNRRGEPSIPPYYALVKGGKLYIWAGNYPGSGKYYTRVLEQGRYLFMVDEISIKPESELKSELGQFAGRVGIVIDMETGVPQIVDDALMEELMAPYPALKEKYLFKDILKFPFQLTRVQNVIAEINRLEGESGD